MDVGGDDQNTDDEPNTNRGFIDLNEVQRRRLSRSRTKAEKDLRFQRFFCGEEADSAAAQRQEAQLLLEMIKRLTLLPRFEDKLDDELKRAELEHEFQGGPRRKKAAIQKMKQKHTLNHKLKRRNFVIKDRQPILHEELVEEHWKLIKPCTIKSYFNFYLERSKQDAMLERRYFELYLQEEKAMKKSIKRRRHSFDVDFLRANYDTFGDDLSMYASE